MATIFELFDKIGFKGPKVYAKKLVVPLLSTIVYNISRSLDKDSTLSLITGSNANLELSGTKITAKTPIPNNASQIAVIREVSGFLAIEYSVTITAKG